MFKISPKCSKCQKKIEGNEEILVKMKYPENRGFAEIKAFLQYEGKIICSKCFNKLEIKLNEKI